MKFNGTEIEFRQFSELLQQFSPENKPELVEDNPEVKLRREGNSLIAKSDRGILHVLPNFKETGIMKYESEKLALYNLLKIVFDKKLDWGILTGVKPVKLFRKLEKSGLEPEKILKENWKLSQEKINLLKTVNDNQRNILDSYNQNNHISLYIGIPMCFSKCTYCSFVTTVVTKDRTVLQNYLQNLKYEIERTGEFLRDKDIIIDSIYIGGGTPSILRAEELDDLLETITKHLNMNDLKEFTFESGRPETTTPELIEVLKKYPIDRICLNPQTMNQETLELINRHYSPEDIKSVFRLLRENGFNNINMDLIFGLENETEEDLLHSLNELIKLDPEDITIHDLSIKKGSKLKEENGIKVKERFSKEFYNKVYSLLNEHGYNPYYMYRQKYTIGNGENIGFSKKGSESIYNILMMAEEQTILGLGAGSSGKLYNKQIDQFNKVFTVKDIQTYNNRIEEIITKKLDQYKIYFEKIRGNNEDSL